MNTVNIRRRATGEKGIAVYSTTGKGHKRYNVDGKFYSDTKFDATFAIISTEEENELPWKSNVKALFEEIIENGGHAVAAAHMPLKITFALLTKVAARANQLQDPELNSLMARLALYAECDPYSKDFKGEEFTKQVVDQDPTLYK